MVRRASARERRSIDQLRRVVATMSSPAPRGPVGAEVSRPRPTAGWSTPARHHDAHHDASAMRTTLTVDDDVLQQLRERAVQQRLPLVEVVNRTLRRGLAEEVAARAADPTVVYGSASGSGPDDAALRAWRDRLDDERHPAP